MEGDNFVLGAGEGAEEVEIGVIAGQENPEAISTSDDGARRYGHLKYIIGRI